MTQTVRTTTRDTTASATARMFAAGDIGSVVVTSSETKDILGIVTKSDIMHQVAVDADLSSITVGSFMSTPVVTVTSDKSIREAATLMREHSIQHLPVVDTDELVGIVTTTNLAHYLPRLRRNILRSRNELSSPDGP
ncbi:CBS domain-containing protein [Natronococcus sp. A-GB7]|uniref:CBS domain-containing protein n=1 Tax=Natronococcus sp. A-GB7 TaxID=3037649 RepID=UPI00241D12A1|nr:CBS domain-containing protein [Natronococcus sp. A-GB7]MDG5821877.1 CBS domain-containing protein [Natronococcus sp. A-GB7]